MAAFKWKPLADYSSFGQLLAVFMWEQRPPLNPTQLADLTHIEYLTVYRWFTYNTAPDPGHLLRIAQNTPIPLHALFVAAGYGTVAYPVFSRTEAWEYIRNQVLAATTIGLEERDIALKVLQLVRDEATQPEVHSDQPTANLAEPAEVATAADAPNTQIKLEA